MTVPAWQCYLRDSTNTTMLFIWQNQHDNAICRKYQPDNAICITLPTWQCYVFRSHGRTTQKAATCQPCLPVSNRQTREAWGSCKNYQPEGAGSLGSSAIFARYLEGEGQLPGLYRLYFWWCLKWEYHMPSAVDLFHFFLAFNQSVFSYLSTRVLSLH